MKATIGINFLKFDLQYREIVLFAVLRMEDVLSSPIFYSCLAEEIANSNSLEGELSKWKNKSTQDIYDAIFPITLYLNTYFTYSNVIGYGVGGDENIYINTKYLRNYNINDANDLMLIGSNLLHEHGHNVGFDHDFKSTKRRPNSIAYILGTAYKKAYQQYYAIPLPEVVPMTFIPWYKRLFKWIF